MKYPRDYVILVDNWGARYNEISHSFWIDIYYKGKQVTTCGSKPTWEGTSSLWDWFARRPYTRHANDDGTFSKWDAKKKEFVLCDQDDYVYEKIKKENNLKDVAEE